MRSPGGGADRSVWLAAALLLMLAGCASAPRPVDYAKEWPRLDLREYFTGTVDGWGYVKNRSGKVVRRMSVAILCTWEGDEGTLDESFTWSDGKTEKRVWKIRKRDDAYRGTAGDVVGEAVGTSSSASAEAGAAQVAAG